jgi:hypothetical protein
MRHMPGLMGVYPTHEEYGNATIEEITTQFSGDVGVKEINNLQSVMFINGPGDTFSMKPLPKHAQFSPVFGVLYDDLNKNSVSQLYIVGNLRGGDVYTGSYDAMRAFIFDAGSDSDFLPVSMVPLGEAGITLNGYARSIYKIGNSAGKNWYAIVYDTGEVQFFERLVYSQINKDE